MGDAYAQYSLGVCYYKGDGVKEDKAEAVTWFRKAVELGDADAKKILQRIEN
ncbi:MAG: SEL1-like repeat protein [Planctomycetaceae bacterium]|nr:SEL1-like repeat protein [Planctomycetaceae bacterium]